jgi:hypothetical protein
MHILPRDQTTSINVSAISQWKIGGNKRNLNCFYSVSANKCKQMDYLFTKNIHQSMPTNWENSSSMLQSPKFFLLISMSLSLNCFCSVSANRHKQKDCFLWKNMHQSMSRNWENSCSMLWSPPKYLFYVE